MQVDAYAMHQEKPVFDAVACFDAVLFT